jgi:hypothetical protein
MAAFPFGGHPTFGQYIAWAVHHGCTVKSGVILVEGQPYCVTRIFDRAGKNWVTEIGTEQKDLFVPTTIGRFDRRLGLKSPFFSIDYKELDPGRSAPSEHSIQRSPRWRQLAGSRAG